MNIYLQDNIPHDPGGTMICQIKKYLEKLHAIVSILPNRDKVPQDLYMSFKIIKELITKRNLNLIHNKTTYEHYNHLSTKRKLEKLSVDC